MFMALLDNLWMNQEHSFEESIRILIGLALDTASQQCILPDQRIFLFAY